jgi:hypothetical protein
MTRDDLVKQKQDASAFFKMLTAPDIGGIKMQHDAHLNLMRWENAIHIWDSAYEAGAKAEREVCAKVCENGINAKQYPTLTEIAEAIRARGAE